MMPHLARCGIIDPARPWLAEIPALSIARPLRTSITDTAPEAEEVQIRLLREAGVERRFGLAMSLSHTAIELSRGAIRQRHPDWSEREVKLEFVRLCYGEKLASEVRAYLERRGA